MRIFRQQNCSEALPEYTATPTTASPNQRDASGQASLEGSNSTHDRFGSFRQSAALPLSTNPNAAVNLPVSHEASQQTFLAQVDEARYTYLDRVRLAEQIIHLEEQITGLPLAAVLEMGLRKKGNLDFPFDLDRVASFIIEELRVAKFFEKIVNMKARVYSAGALLHRAHVEKRPFNKTLQKLSVTISFGSFTTNHFMVNREKFNKLKDAFRGKDLTGPGMTPDKWNKILGYASAQLSAEEVADIYTYLTSPVGRQNIQFENRLHGERFELLNSISVKEAINKAALAWLNRRV